MAKKLIIFIFLTMFIAALSVFFQRSKPQLPEKPSAFGGASPRIHIENINIFRYTESKLNSITSAQEAKLFEPNLLILKGSVNAESYKDDGSLDAMRSQVATALFEADGISQMIEGSEIDRIVFQKDVQFALGSMDIKTEQAIYHPKTNYLSSRKKVKVSTSGRDARADGGFTLNLDVERLRMRGQVDGVFN